MLVGIIVNKLPFYEMSKEMNVKDKYEVKFEEPAIAQPFQQLFISCPDGLNVRYRLESHVGKFLWVRSYMSRCTGNPTICIGKNKGADQLFS